MYIKYIFKEVYLSHLWLVIISHKIRKHFCKIRLKKYWRSAFSSTSRQKFSGKGGGQKIALRVFTPPLPEKNSVHAPGGIHLFSLHHHWTLHNRRTVSDKNCGNKSLTTIYPSPRFALFLLGEGGAGRKIYMWHNIKSIQITTSIFCFKHERAFHFKIWIYLFLALR